MITADRDRCKKDGICAAVCTVGIIDLKGGDEFPSIAPEDEGVCIQCGQCVAVCPHSALSHMVMTPDECGPVETERMLTNDQVDYLMRSRRSIRCYKDKSADQDTLLKILDTVRYAPSGHNSQPVRWQIISGIDEVQRLAGLTIDWMRNMLEKKPKMAREMTLDRSIAAWDAGIDRVCRRAPHLIITHAHKQDSTAQAACTIALAYLELTAPAFGLGTCWAGHFNMAAVSWAPLRDALELPEGHKSYGAMMIGYPEYKYSRIPKRNEAVVTWR